MLIKELIEKISKLDPDGWIGLYSTETGGEEIGDYIDSLYYDSENYMLTQFNTEEEFEKHFDNLFETKLRHGRK